MVEPSPRLGSLSAIGQPIVQQSSPDKVWFDQLLNAHTPIGVLQTDGISRKRSQPNHYHGLFCAQIGASNQSFLKLNFPFRKNSRRPYTTEAIRREIR